MVLLEYNAAISTSLIIISKIGGTISFFSSFLTARCIKKSKPSWEDVLLPNIVIFGISVICMIGSFFGWFMGPWMVGDGDPWIQTGPLLAGNTKTCTAQGFVTFFAYVYFVTAYTGLGALYCLIVRRGWKINDMKKRKIRAAFILPPIIASLGLSVPPLFFQMYNPSFDFCFLNQYPDGCERDADDDVPCTRGAKWTLNFQKAVLLYCLLCNFIIIILMGMLVFSVFSQERKGDRYLSKGQGKSRQNTINTAWQGVRFSLALTIAELPSYVFFGYSLKPKWEMNDTNFLVWIYLHVILTPLLGFNTALVFFYPRYKSYRRQNQDKSKITCICNTIGIGVPVMKSIRSSDEIEETENLIEPLVDDSEEGKGNVI